MTIKILYTKLPSPSVQALKLLKLKQIEDFCIYSKESISCLHGIGPNAIKIIEKEMAELDLSFCLDAKYAPSIKDSINLLDEYIELYPLEIRNKLTEIRTIIKNAAPMAIEKISYNVPTFYYFGSLVHFSATNNFIGFNPISNCLFQFNEEISKYKTTKGFIRFPIDQPLPKKLIEDIVLFRITENVKTSNKKKEN